jgi:hypothetical protein
MLMPDPPVWVLNLPVERGANSQPNSLIHTFMNLTRGAKAHLLLFFAILICAILPTMVTLAIYLTSFIPWSTILAWVVNSVHQVVLRQPTLALAPTDWVALLSLSLFEPPKEQSETVPLTRRQRRRFTKLLKQSLAPPRFNAGIASLVPSPSPTTRLRYPLRANYFPTRRLSQLGDSKGTDSPTSASRRHAPQLPTLRSHAA